MLNWFAENMTQVASPVKIVGIMAARTSDRFFTLIEPLFLKAGPMRSRFIASAVWANLSPTLSPSAETNISRAATASAINIAVRPRTKLKINFLFLFMADPPDLLGRLLFKAQHILAHDFIIEL